MPMFTADRLATRAAPRIRSRQMDLRPYCIDRRAVGEKPSLLRSYFWRCQDDVGYAGTIRRDGCFVIEAKLTLLEGEIVRSEEHTSELQSLMRISYAVLCLKQKNVKPKKQT